MELFLFDHCLSSRFSTNAGCMVAVLLEPESPKWTIKIFYLVSYSAAWLQDCCVPRDLESAIQQYNTFRYSLSSLLSNTMFEGDNSLKWEEGWLTQLTILRRAVTFDVWQHVNFWWMEQKYYFEKFYFHWMLSIDWYFTIGTESLYYS